MASPRPSDVLWYEQVVNASGILGAMGYGIHLTVAYRCVGAILRNRDRGTLKWLPFVGILFTLGTVNIASALRFNQLAFIDERNYPGGPTTFFSQQQGNSANVAAVSTSILMLVFANIFMIYRIHLLWRRMIVTGVLSVILLASVVMSAFHAIQLTSVGGFFKSASIEFSVPYVSLATSLNIFITMVLVPRLLELRRQVSLSVDDLKEKFTSVEALVVESALPSGLISLAFIILYGFRKPSSLLFLTLLVQAMAIMPEMIILRIASGWGWSPDVVRRLRPTSIGFSNQRAPSHNFQNEEVALEAVNNRTEATKSMGGYS